MNTGWLPAPRPSAKDIIHILVVILFRLPSIRHHESRIHSFDQIIIIIIIIIITVVLILISTKDSLTTVLSQRAIRVSCGRLLAPRFPSCSS